MRSPAEFTVLDVGSAVSRQLGLMPDSVAVSALAGKLHAFVNANMAFRTSGLDGSDFRTLVISNLTPEIARELNREQANQIRKEQQEAGVGKPDNPFWVGQGRFFPVNGVSVSDDGGRSAGYDSLPGSLTPAQKDALELALKNNLDWVAGKPDLLRLGKAAIQTLIEAKLKEDTYKKLEGVRYRAKDIVTMSDFANKNGKDANELGDAITQSNRTLATDANGKVNARALDELRDADTAYMANPGDAKAKERHEQTQAKYATTPAKKKAAESKAKALETQTKVELKEDASATKKEGKAAQSQTTVVVTKSAVKSKFDAF